MTNDPTLKEIFCGNHEIFFTSAAPLAAAMPPAHGRGRWPLARPATPVAVPHISHRGGSRRCTQRAAREALQPRPAGQRLRLLRSSAHHPSPQSQSFRLVIPAPAPVHQYSTVQYAHEHACEIPNKRLFHFSMLEYSGDLGGVVVRLLAVHQSEPGFYSSCGHHDFRVWKTRQMFPLAGEFSRGTAVSHANSFTLTGAQDLEKNINSFKYIRNPEKEGNLHELLELRGNEIADIKDWLFKRHNWLFNDIQNEILQLLSLTVVRNLNQDIKKNKYFALIVEETADNSTTEQVSISLRHVNDDFDVFEDFIGLYETSSTTGDTLAAIIEDVLWAVRSKSLNVVNSQYQTILSVLDSLKSKESVATGLSAFFEKTSSLFYLEVSVIVFGITEELARNLQISDISITSALRQTEVVKGRLTDLKTEKKFTELWEKVKKLGGRSRCTAKQYSSPEQFLRQKYFAVADIIKGEIESRFQYPGVAIYKAIENVLVKSSNGEVENIRDQVLQICEHFKVDLNVERFTRQLAMSTELTAVSCVEDVDVLAAMWSPVTGGGLPAGVRRTPSPAPGSTQHATGRSPPRPTRVHWHGRVRDPGPRTGARARFTVARVAAITCRRPSAYWSLCFVFIGCCPTPGSYGIRKAFPCKSAIGSEARKVGLINIDPIAKMTCTLQQNAVAGWPVNLWEGVQRVQYSGARLEGPQHTLLRGPEFLLVGLVAGQFRDGAPFANQRLCGVTPECKGGGKRELPEKSRSLVASCGTIPHVRESRSDPVGNRIRLAYLGSKLNNKLFCFRRYTHYDENATRLDKRVWRVGAKAVLGVCGGVDLIGPAPPLQPAQISRPTSQPRSQRRLAVCQEVLVTQAARHITAPAVSQILARAFYLPPRDVIITPAQFCSASARDAELTLVARTRNSLPLPLINYLLARYPLPQARVVHLCCLQLARLCHPTAAEMLGKWTLLLSDVRLTLSCHYTARKYKIRKHSVFPIASDFGFRERTMPSLQEAFVATVTAENDHFSGS
ncbi:hypothetical protein PR048_001177 [Dryococelus australis]|uniref:Uncharacterized protein n=1 Tax=Dryococelus australis TaxID=614101 RepID=A0ABQ9IJ23_9NEOP|nr:hypothetical protein PR048_001177 [Dryococelus australis]